jgi:hypothetical protein
MKHTMMTLIVLVLVLVSAGAVRATGYRWQDHAPPFDFLFDNDIDLHQQTKIVGTDQLQGFFYIRFTGEVTIEDDPIAEHANCTTVPDECTVGWMLHGIPLAAEYCGQPDGQHPIWFVAPEDFPAQPGYTHFHWLNASAHASGLTVGEIYDGYLLKLTARDTFFFKHHDGFLVTPGIDYETHANIVTSVTDCENRS